MSASLVLFARDAICRGHNEGYKRPVLTLAVVEGLILMTSHVSVLECRKRYCRWLRLGAGRNMGVSIPGC